MSDESFGRANGGRWRTEVVVVVEGGKSALKKHSFNLLLTVLTNRFYTRRATLADKPNGRRLKRNGRFAIVHHVIED